MERENGKMRVYFLDRKLPFLKMRHQENVWNFCGDSSEFIRQRLRKAIRAFRKCTGSKERERLGIRLRLLPSCPRYETKRFLPAERSHNRRVARERARFSADDYSKKASSDYAHLIGWDSHGNCEVNWFLMMGPPIATAISRASSLYSLFFFFQSFCPTPPSAISLRLPLPLFLYHRIIIIQFRLRNSPICTCDYSNSIYAIRYKLISYKNLYIK